ncbi:tRNA threonylcarbamoyladenosine biosynthesis protein TsaE [Hypnocyclicus thermotrophus]|uniref:tRNA threonylcarbamoyladenosine biosynthesis protein TsaE n=1 Tax=Hypnocyclicus thermotrophus TaxID=1627895 RepID=A0AA46DXA2_9FUSO|nr:tRNA (adenosine(37)-N6)-threonylcarbamoyltransferase complex ATPase subunit type 1 TsaE [Hypnocyclicus thermotrophus]TDT67899.1 tRNA threonylcarbamoyladenosine biosynthesis protein TsaE [Hypnocyclicus thermotrophus]
MKKVLTFSEIDTLVDKLSNIIKKNDVIALIGDLGTGKTTFVKRFAKNLGITENVKSPTFTYVMEYRDIEPALFHFDVYRICDAEEIYEIGYEDYLHNDGIVIIEWANLIESELPEEYLKIELFHKDENSRGVEIKYIGNEKREKEILEYVDFSN